MKVEAIMIMIIDRDYFGEEMFRKFVRKFSILTRTYVRVGALGVPACELDPKILLWHVGQTLKSSGASRKFPSS